MRTSKIIKVNLRGKFAKSYLPSAPEGTEVIIDAIAGYNDSETRLMMRVVNIWKKPAWFDSFWFDIE